MANQNGAFGFRAVRMQGSAPSSNGQTRYAIANGENSGNIFQGSLVKMVSGGTVQVASGVADIALGVFNGAQWVDISSAKPTWSNYFPSTTTSYDGIISAFVIDDPNQLFEVQVSGAMTLANIGETANVVNMTDGYTGSGTAQSQVNSETFSTGANTAVRIVGLSDDPENSDLTANNANIVVKLNKHFYSSNLAGI
jgi:hypothetical protein|tara:strand:- start:160 stop:747 length:588 start_codon:yes stop_codon:yes gene_type:complete